MLAYMEGVRGWATVQYWEGDLRPVGLTADGVTATRIIQIAMTSVRCSFPISVCRPLLVSRVHKRPRVGRKRAERHPENAIGQLRNRVGDSNVLHWNCRSRLSSEDVNVRPDIDVTQSISTTLICNPIEVLALGGGGRMRPVFQS